MSIEKRGDHSYRVQTQYRDDTGAYRWIRKTLRFPPTTTERAMLREARTEESRLIAQARAQWGKPAAVITFSQFGDIFVARHCAALSPLTRYAYEKRIAEHLDPYFGAMKLNDITSEDVNAFTDSLIANHYAPSTVQSIFRSLHTILAYAVRWKYIESSPAEAADRPRGSRSEPEALTESRIRTLVSLILQHPDVSTRCAVLLAVLCGLRREEIVGLRLVDIDFDNASLTIRRAGKYTPTDGNIISTTKTPSSNRTIAVPDILMDQLRADRSELLALSASRSGGGGAAAPEGVVTPCDYIYHNARGQAKATNTLSVFWANWAARNGFGGTTLHGLRHAHASILIANNIDIVTVSKRLGHTSTSTTLNIYAHALARRDAESANVLNTILNNSEPSPTNLPNTSSKPQ